MALEYAQGRDGDTLEISGSYIRPTYRGTTSGQSPDEPGNTRMLQRSVATLPRGHLVDCWHPQPRGASLTRQAGRRLDTLTQWGVLALAPTAVGECARDWRRTA